MSPLYVSALCLRSMSPLYVPPCFQESHTQQRFAEGALHKGIVIRIAIASAAGACALQRGAALLQSVNRSGATGSKGAPKEHRRCCTQPPLPCPDRYRRAALRGTLPDTSPNTPCNLCCRGSGTQDPPLPCTQGTQQVRLLNRTSCSCCATFRADLA
jgi:hypothetical protein